MFPINANLNWSYDLQDTDGVTTYQIAAPNQENANVQPLEQTVSWWSWNPINLLFSAIAQIFMARSCFADIASRLENNIPANGDQEEVTNASRASLLEFSAYERLCIWLAPKQFREAVRLQVGARLANMRRPPLELAHNGHTVSQISRQWRDGGGNQIWKTDDKAMPTSYEPAHSCTNICNSRIVVGPGDRLIAAGGSVPNSELKALQAILPIIEKRIGDAQAGQVYELPVVIHSHLSSSILQPGERGMLEEEQNAFNALSNRVIQIGQKQIRVVPMLISTPSNGLSAWRNGPLSALFGYNHSDEISAPGLRKLIEFALRNSGKVDLAATIRDSSSLDGVAAALAGEDDEISQIIRSLLGEGERPDPVLKSLYIYRLTKAAGASLFEHCKSCLDRAGGMLTILSAYELLLAGEQGLTIANAVAREDFKELVQRGMERVAKVNTFMSTGLEGLKYGDFLTNDIFAPYLPANFDYTSLFGYSHLRGV